jgi:formylglycine-generating enzyme required for sulfatase activity
LKEEEMEILNESDFVLLPYKKPFYMQKTQVTQKQWMAVMGDNPSHFKGDDLPVDSVSWLDVQEFIKKLNVLEGKKYRLPKNKEWFFACGDDPENLDDYAWYRGNSNKTTHPVGTKIPNGYGIYDMLGNVWEWCGNKPGEKDYVLRGGSWTNIPEIVRAAYRTRLVPAFRYFYFGFRLSLSAPRLCPHCGKEIT